MLSSEIYDQRIYDQKNTNKQLTKLCKQNIHVIVLQNASCLLGSDGGDGLIPYICSRMEF